MEVYEGMVWLQVWMVVQRKWMYLEGIFIGGDIRAQLPEEAKKFDAIDKLFKKVHIGICIFLSSFILRLRQSFFISTL